MTTSSETFIRLPPVLAAPRDFDHVLAETLGSDALAVCILRGSVITCVNPGCRALFGLAIEECQTLLTDLAIPGDRDWLGQQLHDLHANSKKSLSLTFQAQGPSGTPVDIELHAVPTLISGSTDALAFLFDVTQQRRHQEQLSFLAFLDPLTGLPNRAMFLDRCREVLMAARQRNIPFAVMFSDLDGFKAVNDRLGHAAGDMLLKVIAERLASCVRENDVVAWLGGDEFAFLMPSIGDKQAAGRIAGRIINEISAPIHLGDHDVKVGISIGIAFYPEHASDIDTLNGLADQAMYASKEAGRNRWTLAERGDDAKPLTVEFLVWSPNHEVGIEIIDQQHRELVNLVNRLGNDLKNGQGHGRLQAVFQELLAHTERHFHTEEALMSEYGLVSLTAHRQKHEQLLEDIRNFGEHLDRRSMALTMRYLQEWLLRHIDSMDKGLGKLLQAQGVR